MIEFNSDASNKLFKVFKHNLTPHQGYDAPPIYYWFRNVIEAIKLIDNGNEMREGDYHDPLEKSLGIVYYSANYIGNNVIYLITDFEKLYQKVCLSKAKRADIYMPVPKSVI